MNIFSELFTIKFITQNYILSNIKEIYPYDISRTFIITQSSFQNDSQYMIICANNSDVREKVIHFNSNCFIENSSIYVLTKRDVLNNELKFQFYRNGDDKSDIYFEVQIRSDFNIFYYEKDLFNFELNIKNYLKNNIIIFKPSLFEKGVFLIENEIQIFIK